MTSSHPPKGGGLPASATVVSTGVNSTQVRAYIRFRKDLASTFSLARQTILYSDVFKCFDAVFISAARSGVFSRKLINGMNIDLISLVLFKL